MTSKIFSIDRHRFKTDGDGITTLIAFHGCPLQCKYYINDICHKDIDTYSYTIEELYSIVSIDDIYFRMPNGGIVFGGGEPILQSQYIKDFISICPEEWNFRIETSLYCDKKQILDLIDCIDEWIIDIKDMNPAIYLKYTECNNDIVLENISLLTSLIPKDKILFRIPHIPNYNTEKDIQYSISRLEHLGRLDVFEYEMEL